MTQIVQKIIETEWMLFDKVHNIGGRASCQDDKRTFYIMRSSQLMAWNAQMQESYYYDLQDAVLHGRNLLTEKYAYMMQRTSPVEYLQIQNRIPKRTLEKDRLIDEICAVHVNWQEDVAKRYPALAGQGRAIRKSQDSIYVTSFETYLWGELATYSLKTVKLYAEYVQKLKREGKNLCEIILQNTVKQYGYSSLDEAENRSDFA